MLQEIVSLLLFYQLGLYSHQLAQQIEAGTKIIHGTWILVYHDAKNALKMFVVNILWTFFVNILLLSPESWLFVVLSIPGFISFVNSYSPRNDIIVFEACFCNLLLDLL